MEEKKFDINSVLGFVLIGAILIWMLYQNKAEVQPNEDTPTTEEVTTTKPDTSNITPKQNTALENQNNFIADSLKQEEAKIAAENRLGSFAYSETLPSAKSDFTILENEVLYLEINNKGGYISKARLKKHTTFTGEPVYLIKEDNALLNLQFTSENRVLETQDLYFEPSTFMAGDNHGLSMKLKVSDSQYLEYRYELQPNDYMLGFSVRSQGLNGTWDASKPFILNWQLKGYRHAKSITYENRYTRLTYEYEDGKHAKLSATGEDEETEKNVSWFNFRQHFFSSMLLSDVPLKEVELYSENLLQDEAKDTIYTKQYRAAFKLEPSGGELAQEMDMFYGPTDYKLLKSYDRNLDNAMPLGWGIFGIINKYIIIPLFDLLSGFLPAGIAIIVLTILVKVVLSPVQYRQFLAQAKMKVLKPDMDAIKEKFKGNQMKIQQETLKLQNAAGASPIKGCLPALLQIPVFYALFTFFPSAFSLRQQPFLWADDLSSYDTIADLPFTIPFYGDHVSLFPILASIAIFIYMTMTTGQTMQAQQQPGMPNMKVLMYISPLFMLVFFNNYASGLSLYYFISNLITIGIMLVIKNFIIDEDKVRAKIQVTKQKPRKQNRFQRKIQEVMEQAEKQQKAKKR